MADFNASAYVAPDNGTCTAATSFKVIANAEINTIAEVTRYYLMYGFDTVFPLVPTVWTVVGAPDLTGALSGNPTINAATIRELFAWTETP